MNRRFKKFFRSAEVLFPGAENAKFAAHNWVYHHSGRIYKPELKGLRHFAFRGKLLLDVGANRGQSIVAFKNAAPGCRIISFEPNQILAKRLIARYANDRNVQIESCALSNQPGTLTLYIPSYRNFLFDGLASIHPEVGKWFDRDRFYFFNPAKVSIHTSSVPVRTLDSFELAPSLIKLHAQRAEVLILQGAEKTIARHRPVIITAWAWDEEIETLLYRGYRPFRYSGGSFRAGINGEFTWFLLPDHIDSLCDSPA